MYELLFLLSLTTAADVVANAERVGMSNDRAQALRGATIVPTRTTAFDPRVGRLEEGKDADLLHLSPSCARAALFPHAMVPILPVMKAPR